MGYQLDFGVLVEYFGLLLKGVGVTLGLTAIAATLGIALSIGGAATARWGLKWARTLVALYVELIRNTPFIVQLFFLFFGLPGIGIKLSPEAASVLAMVVNLGAYAAEIVRAGIATTPRGQIEAAQSLALTDMQVFTRVVLPPALQRVWPALVSQIIIVMLGSAVCGQISTPELSHASSLIHSRNFRAFESTFIAMLLYLLLASPVYRADTLVQIDNRGPRNLATSLSQLQLNPEQPPAFTPRRRACPSFSSLLLIRFTQSTAAGVSAIVFGVAVSGGRVVCCCASISLIRSPIRRVAGLTPRGAVPCGSRRPAPAPPSYRDPPGSAGSRHALSAAAGTAGTCSGIPATLPAPSRATDSAQPTRALPRASSGKYPEPTPSRRARISCCATRVAKTESGGAKTRCSGATRSNGCA